MLEFAEIMPWEEEVVEKITHRAVHMFARVGIYRTPADVRMDLEATHAKMPLRLAELAEAPDFDFAHDMGGIYRHLNRETGELEDFFVPRFAAPERST
jgi:hypothetical protein